MESEFMEIVKRVRTAQRDTLRAYGRLPDEMAICLGADEMRQFRMGSAQGFLNYAAVALDGRTLFGLPVVAVCEKTYFRVA